MNRRVHLVLVIATVATLLAGCQSGPRIPEGAPDAVVLIVIDTLRADHLGCMGYERATTPRLDALASAGVLFRDAMTPVPVTFPAVSSLLTGRFPPRHSVRDNGGFTLPASEETLAERFLQAGWRTGAAVGSAVLDGELGLGQGFERYDDDFGPPYPTYDERYRPLEAQMALDRRRADTVTDRAVAMAETFGTKPYFLLVHYFDVHSVYDPPPVHAERHPFRDYDGEISFVDEQIGRLLDGLDRQNALVVVVSDHGEGLYDHGEPEHGFLLYQSTLHVPVIAAGPGVEAGLVRDDPISLVDLAPTLAEAGGLSPSNQQLDGVALTWNEPQREERDLYAETMRTLLSYSWSELRALRRGNRKLIHGPRDELYDLASDPTELSPLPVDAGAPLLAELTALEATDPVARIIQRKEQGLDPARAEQLASLGYVDGGTPTIDQRDRPHPIDMLPAWRERQLNRARLRQVQLHLRQNELRMAIALLDTVLTFEPRRADVFYARGMVKERLGQLGDSAADMQRALDVDPSYAPALEKVIEDRLRRGEIESAIPYLRTLVQAKPDDANPRYNLGVAAHRLGDSETAKQQLGEFLKIAPGDARATGVKALLRELEEGEAP